MEQFIYQFIPNKRPELFTDPDAWTEEDTRIAERHFQYLKNATETGVVILAGRDPSGIGPAIVIFEAESKVKAREFMNYDPFIDEGFFLAELHMFRVALQREI